MLKKLTTLLLIAFLVPAVSAQDVAKKAAKHVEPVAEQSSNTNNTNGPVSTSAANFVVADVMGNFFGPAIGNLKPLAYDPYSNTLAFAHRGDASYGAGGQIWYNMSTDAGATWTRVGSVMGALSASGRYPTMTLNNGLKSASREDVLAAFVWPHLAASFEDLGYSVDYPVGGNNPSATFVDNTLTPPALGYSTSVQAWGSDNSQHTFWVVPDIYANLIHVFSTEDFLTVKNDFTSIDSTKFGTGSEILAGTSVNGVQYLGILGTFGDGAPGGWTVGYAKSTDYGATWSEFTHVYWTSIPSIANHERLFDAVKGDEFVTYQGDMVVDKNGLVHFGLVLTDSTGADGADEIGTNSVVEVFETAPGVWDAKVVFSGIKDFSYSDFNSVDPSLGQMGINLHMAMDSTRSNIFMSYAHDTSPVDTVPVHDIFVSSRSLGGNWSAPVNITESANVNESSNHLAPWVKTNGANSFSMFVEYVWDPAVTDVTLLNTGTQATAYVANYPITVTDVNDEAPVVSSYSLNQNYPNPFNPSTAISFTLAEKSNVSLRVFDMLGREVATLINNEVRNNGQHVVNFNAANLTSGVYIYKLQAGNFTEARKMTLVK